MERAHRVERMRLEFAPGTVGYGASDAFSPKTVFSGLALVQRPTLKGSKGSTPAHRALRSLKPASESYR